MGYHFFLSNNDIVFSVFYIHIQAVFCILVRLGQNDFQLKAFISILRWEIIKCVLALDGAQRTVSRFLKLSFVYQGRGTCLDSLAIQLKVLFRIAI